MLNRWADRLFAILGLDLDFSVSLGRAPFNQVADDIYLGGRPEPETVPALDEVGITHVVSCLSEDAGARVAFLGERFEPLFLPLRDGMHEDIGAVFPTFFDFVTAAHERREGAKVLVHCEAGVSRSATLVTALLMRRTGKRSSAAALV